MRKVLAAAILAVLVAAGACSSSGPKTTPAASGAKPNIVFVLTDDLSMNLLPYMPHVKDMAKRGVTFSNYFVSDSLCCPSRSSIFTGRFPHDTQVFTNTGVDGGYHVFRSREEDKDTFATTLQAAGYRTALMGKYLNGYLPKYRVVPAGWDTWAVGGNAYAEFDYALNENGTVKAYGKKPGEYLTDVLSAKATTFIEGAAAAKKPFMLEVATFSPHGPFIPAPRDADKFPDLAVPRTPAFGGKGTNEPEWLSRIPALSAQSTSALDGAFRRRAQSVVSVDKMIGDLQKTLKHKGIVDNTYVVFSSDNGFHLGEHRLVNGKLTAFDTDIRVPLVVVGPGVPKNRTVREVVQNVDLRPTFEELGGATTPASINGRSLVPLLRGKKASDWRDAALVEHHGPVLSPFDPDKPAPDAANPPSYAAVRTADAVYVEYIDGEREYYRTSDDPDELNNLFGSLSAAERDRLHAVVSALTNCHNAESCWTAAHMS
jgi:arylsulfatase A-like enzyme